MINFNSVKGLDFWSQIQSIFTNSRLHTIKDSNGSISNYHYFTYPFKGFDIHKPAYEVFIANCLSKMLDNKIDLLVTFESDGIGITKLVSSITDVPMLVCKPFHYNRECIKFTQLSGYHKRLLYLPKKLIDDKRIAILDVIVSTGGTINNFLEALVEQTTDVNVTGIYSVVHKHNYNDYRINPEQLFGKLDYKFLFELEIDSNKESLETKVNLSKYSKEIMQSME